MISITIIPPLLMAAIAMYVAISYFLMYVHRRSETEHLWFSLMCSTIALYDIFSALLYGTTSPEKAILFQRLQFITLAMFIIAIVWFIAALTHIREYVIYGLSICMLVFIVGGIFLPESTLTLSSKNLFIKQFSLFGATITYNEADPGIFYVAQYFSMLMCGIFLLYKTFLWSRYGDIHLKMLFLSLLIFLLTSINDVLVGKGIYQFLYLVEYGYFFVILSMAYILQYRFVNLHREIEKLSFLMNRQLQEKESEKASSDSAKQRLLSASNSEKIQKVIEYIHNNYLFDISREGLASMIDMHPDTFSRFFKTYTGKTLPDYINHLRIAHAKELLSANNDSIISIAFQCGFESLSTFNRAFHKIHNTTPTACRRQNRVS